MTRTKENAHKSPYYTNKTIRTKIDKRLEKINSLQATLGIDSTNKERKDVMREQIGLELEIKELDLEFWELTFKVEKE